MKDSSSYKLAVLIDADNTSADIIEPLLEEISKYGIASVRRIYGDWSSGLKKWKNALLPHAITPVQQFAYTKGKNATDMALVIDAMDLLYTGTFDGFCIISSDSDFTRLASRIRENGLMVYGFGQRKTSEAFRKACDKFVFTEIFQKSSGSQNHTEQDILKNSQISHELVELLTKAISENTDDSGWAILGGVGSLLSRIRSDFDVRNYGFSKLSALIKSLPQFEVQSDNQSYKVRLQPTLLLPLPKTPLSNSKKLVHHKNKKSIDKKANDSQIDKKKYSFSQLIPLVQLAINQCKRLDGWARLSDVIRQISVIDSQFQPINYGVGSTKELIKSIYSDWIEIQKAGRGERVRIVKEFII